MADPVIVDSRVVAPEELYLGFLQQLGQLRDKVLPLLLPALREGFWRDGSVFLSVHLSFLKYSDGLLRDARPAFPLNIVGIFKQKSIGVLLGIFGDALEFGLMNLPRIAATGTTAEIVLGALGNPFHRAEGDLKILRQLALRDRLPLIAFMDALPGF